MQYSLLYSDPMTHILNTDSSLYKSYSLKYLINSSLSGVLKRPLQKYAGSQYAMHEFLHNI